MKRLTIFSTSLLLAVSLSAEVALPKPEPVEPEVVDAAEAKAAVIDLSKAIQPRNAAATWSYTSAYFEEGRKISGGTSGEKVIKVVEVDGVTCYLIKLTMDWRSILERLSGVKLTEDDYSYYWEYFNEEGSYNLTLETGDTHELSSLEGFELTIPYPVKKGHSYHSDGDLYEITDDAAVVKVAAGAFSCVVYQMNFIDKEMPENSARERYYMSPGVGLVRWEMDVQLGGAWVLDSRDDLVKYDLKR